MTDSELLSLAAKAAGMDGMPHPEGGLVLNGSFTRWNPIEDDGDALRLATRLCIGIRACGPHDWQSPNTSVALYEVGDYGGRVTVTHGDDPSVASRLAIVRAAAAIGQTMQ